MSLPAFHKAAMEFTDPWKSIIEELDARTRDGRVENFVISGRYDGCEQVRMNAWSIIGLAHGFDRLLAECNQTDLPPTGDMNFWIRKFRELIPIIGPETMPSENRIRFQGLMIHEELGSDRHHFLGMVSLHTTCRTKNDFAVLWRNPSVDRQFVDMIVKFIINERVKLMA